MKQLEKATGSIVVGQIGRTVILYRPSLTKLKAEEKKKQAVRAFTRKLRTPRPSFEVIYVLFIYFGSFFNSLTIA